MELKQKLEEKLKGLNNTYEKQFTNVLVARENLKKEEAKLNVILGQLAELRDVYKDVAILHNSKSNDKKLIQE